ncbi:MAG TPA: dihydrolipoamide acetyltransferase family protein [Spirochaetota bacterium]|nr:dihydrolipoamide acetyltransferase family protein [Spirochaetota bacterium]
MPTILTLPKIGVNMTEAIIVRWLIKEGELIEEGQTILEAETDKATQDIPSTKSGVLAMIIAEPGKTVQTQEPIAVLTEKGETLPDDFSVDAGGFEKKTDEPAPARQGSGFEEKKDASVPDSRVRISPIAKKLAKELNIDYARITPSKAGGRIEKTDVLEYARGEEALGEEVARGAVTEQDKNLIPLSGIRKTIASRMSESVRTTARAVLFTKVDATRLIEWRNGLKESGKKVSYNDLFVHLAAKVLREFPQMNSRIEGENIRIMKDVNIGVAVNSERGLLVPVIQDADKKDVLTITDESSQKIERVKSGRSTREDMSNGTFTLTNLGMFDVESFIPIINPPECAILAVGSIVREPSVVDETDTVSVRPVMRLSLVWDHRIVDGALAARFLQRIKQLIEQGEKN